MSVLVGTASYPENVDKKSIKYGKAYFIDAARIAVELGNIRTVNIILLGVLSKFLRFEKKSWREAIRRNVKEKFVDLNITAFNRGKDIITP